ncbi:hypothetical protein BGZ98_005981 [Dissophora globulifera]|nr:hypothetical protein BGZ98_005981 [Dissophora globulifera]
MDRLFLLLLRSHLAPNRERRQYDRAHESTTTDSNVKSKDKSDATEQTQDRSRNVNKIWHLCDDINTAPESPVAPDATKSSTASTSS